MFVYQYAVVPIEAWKANGSKMKSRAISWPASSAILALAGILVCGIGVYFLAWRPALLPEDIRFMQLSEAEVSSIGPRLANWLAHVFQVLGGYALATGILAVTLAATSFRARKQLAVAGAAIGGAVSIGLMAAVNFAIDSDFKFLLVGVALVWVLSLVIFWVEDRVHFNASSGDKDRT